MSKQMLLLIVAAAWLSAALPAQAADPAGTAVEAANAAAQAPHGAAEGVHGTAEAAHGGDAHGAHEKAPLIPDFSERETQLQALWVVIIFIILLMILYPTAWKNVLAGLKKREERIRRDIADAEAARARAESTLKEYNTQLATAETKVRDILAAAQADAERLATNIRTRAQQESEEIKQRATRDIEAARDQAKSEIHTYAADLAVSVAEKILRRNLNADDQRDLVNQSLEQVQTIGR